MSSICKYRLLWTVFWPDSRGCYCLLVMTFSECPVTYHLIKNVTITYILCTRKQKETIWALEWVGNFQYGMAFVVVGGQVMVKKAHVVYAMLDLHIGNAELNDATSVKVQSLWRQKVSCATGLYV